MFNLTVDTAHTFFVGQGGWLVHNDVCDLTHSLGNVEGASVAHNQATLNEFESGVGFSAAYDPQTKQFLARPSGDAQNPPKLKSGEVAKKWVDGYGGHFDVNQQLGELGADTSKTVGFVISYDGPNQLNLRWTSGSINFPNYGDRAAPVQFRPSIIDTIREATGFNVSEG